MFRSIKDSLVEILSDDKLKPAHEKGNIAVCWGESVGASIRENTTIKSFKNGILTIKAQTPVWRNELLFQKDDILRKLNSRLDNTKIKDIRFL